MANPFIDERFPLQIRAGATWVDDYSVQIIKAANGVEHRRLIHRFPVRSFQVQVTDVRSALWQSVLDLYHLCFGQYAGFRVKCVDDFSTHNHTEAPDPTDFWLGFADTGQYQLRTIYGFAGIYSAYLPAEWYPWRNITRPVGGTVRVAVNGVEQTSGWTVDTDTGIVTFTTAPLITDTVTAGFEFDLPCRFNSAPQVHALSPDLRDSGSIDLIELIE